MATRIEAAEPLLLRAAWMEDNHPDHEEESWRRCTPPTRPCRPAIEGVRIFGGHG
jgi:hypothetical protein